MLNNCRKLLRQHWTIFKGSEDKATNYIENWSLLTTPHVTDAYSPENPSEYLHKPYIAGN